MIDHGTGVVIGETAVIGSNCTLMHGITLGGTGKVSSFDRHPKLGNNVFLGCQVTILGNIRIGDGVTVGAGSIVLKSLPDGATAVGSPAVIKAIKAEYQQPEPKPESDGRIDTPPLPDFDTPSKKIEKNLKLELWSSTWMPKLWSSNGWLDGWRSSSTNVPWEDWEDWHHHQHLIEGFVKE